MENLPQFWQEIKNIYAALEVRKRYYILFGSLISVLLIILLVRFSTNGNYEVLFSGLDPAEAGSIVEKLKEDKVPYRSESGGSKILVPSAKVYDLRLKLAARGMPQVGTVGYEIFDKNSPGTSDFIQKINYRRALEGELARTISWQNEIKSARVHLVIPEQNLFAEDQKESTASITIRLQPGCFISVRQIHGISNLVAASVERLRAENVTIVDSNGNALTQPLNSNSLLALSSSQIELKKSVERHYSDKLKSLLEKVVGKDKVAVQVTADLNFDRVDRTSTKYDPEDPVVLSEVKNVRSPAAGGNRTAEKIEDITTNYEISKTIERLVQEVGNIKRISVAVMVDGKYQIPVEDPITGMAATQPEYVPLSDEEMEQLRSIVKSAVGFSSDRQDEVIVVNMPFDYSQKEEEKLALAEFEKRASLEKNVKLAVYLLIVLLVLFVVVKIMKFIKVIITPYLSEKNSSLPGLDDNIDIGMLKESKDNIRLQQIVSNMSKKNPGDAAKLVKTWLIEDADV